MPTEATIKVLYAHTEDHHRVDKLNADAAYLADAAAGVQAALQAAADKHAPKHGLGPVKVGMPSLVSAVHS